MAVVHVDASADLVEHSIRAVVSINNQSMWAGYINFTVIEKDAEDNINTGTTVSNKIHFNL